MQVPLQARVYANNNMAPNYPQAEISSLDRVITGIAVGILATLVFTAIEIPLVVSLITGSIIGFFSYFATGTSTQELRRRAEPVYPRYETRRQGRDPLQGAGAYVVPDDDDPTLYRHLGRGVEQGSYGAGQGSSDTLMSGQHIPFRTGGTTQSRAERDPVRSGEGASQPTPAFTAPGAAMQRIPQPAQGASPSVETGTFGVRSGRHGERFPSRAERVHPPDHTQSIPQPGSEHLHAVETGTYGQRQDPFAPRPEGNSVTPASSGPPGRAQRRF